MKDLKQLYNSVCRVAMSKPEGRDFYDTWSRIMNMYQFEIVLKAWDNIASDPLLTKWDYLQTNTWVRKCDYLTSQAKADKKDAKQEPVKLSTEDVKQTTQWKNNHVMYVTGQITRETYILNARRSGQMNDTEIRERIQYWAAAGQPLNGYCSNAIGVAKT